jgi:hypothetical protein
MKKIKDKSIKTYEKDKRQKDKDKSIEEDNKIKNGSPSGPTFIF